MLYPYNYVPSETHHWNGPQTDVSLRRRKWELPWPHASMAESSVLHLHLEGSTHELGYRRGEHFLRTNLLDRFTEIHRARQALQTKDYRIRMLHHKRVQNPCLGWKTPSYKMKTRDKTWGCRDVLRASTPFSKSTVSTPKMDRKTVFEGLPPAPWPWWPTSGACCGK